MIDNVKLYIPRCRDMPDISSYLDKGIEKTDIGTGEVSVFGNVDNIKVSQHFGGYYIQGSLPKYMYGDNVCQLTRKEVREVIEKLSDRLHLPLCDAEVTSIEVGANICLSKPISAYVRLLGDMPRMRRVLMAESLYYRGNGKIYPKQYYFYDKVVEVKVKGGTMPKGLEAANMLRYEMRLQGRLAKQLAIQELKVSTLQDRAVYQELISRWLNGYLSINKLSDMKDENLKRTMSVKGAKEIFLAQLIAKSGGSSVIDEFVERLKTESGLAGKRDAICKVKSKLYEIASKSNVKADKGLIEELTRGVKMIAQNS